MATATSGQAPVGINADPQEATHSSTSRRPWKKRLPMVLEMLGAVGRVRELEGRYRQG